MSRRSTRVVGRLVLKLGSPALHTTQFLDAENVEAFYRLVLAECYEE